MQYSEISYQLLEWKISAEIPFDFFNSFAQNIDCGYPKSMFWRNNKSDKFTSLFKYKFIQTVSALQCYER